MKIIRDLAIELVATCVAIVAFDAVIGGLKAFEKNAKIKRALKKEDERLKEELGNLTIVPNRR